MRTRDYTRNRKAPDFTNPIIDNLELDTTTSIMTRLSRIKQARKGADPKKGVAKPGDGRFLKEYGELVKKYLQCGDIHPTDFEKVLRALTRSQSFKSLLNNAKQAVFAE